MSDDIQVTPVGGSGDPRDDFATPEAPATYQPWKRPRTYVTFVLGISAVGCLFGCLSVAAIVLGWVALGVGIAAVLIGRKEIGELPEAERHPFIKWGRRTGMLGIIIGPIAAVIWIVILATVGLGSRAF